MAGGVLFIPGVGNGHGVGHLKRTVNAARSMGKDAWVYLEDDIRDKRLSEVLKGVQIAENPWEKLPWKLVVIDRRETSVKELTFYEQLGPVIAVDEGGSARTFAPYIVDYLGNVAKREKPNIAASPISEINVQNNKKMSSLKQLKKILISFGGEDPAGLTSTLLKKIKRDNIFKEFDISAVEGPLFKSPIAVDGIHIIKHAESLVSIIPEYDLIITSYGLTCFEAIGLNVPVILFNPSRYHRRLSRIAGFPEIGVGKPDMKRLKLLLKKSTSLKGVVERWQKKLFHLKRLDESGFKELVFSGNMKCPVCGQLNRARVRLEDRTYFSCRRCGIVYSSVLNRGKRLYNSRYFYEEYKKQYGKTYVEDFNSIKKTGIARMRIIDRYLKINNKDILDVGCAFGPFLDAARDMGYSATGIDISEEAIDYTVNKLGIHALRADFLNFQGGIFGIITMWYVIEHFEKLSAVLKKVNSNLKKGGLFAFSTPNYRGISGRRNLFTFFSLSPPDHYTIWSPKMAAAVLKKYGFKVVAIRITGHHPERFPIYSRYLDGLYRVISLLFKLGDTFEVYAEKIKDL
ncbi:MAG: methyltransferase domain-containing protein [Spirochaetales bacterium]|nr:methyltransferase domain-containing protein [Spirochaetales bacterium]